MKLLYATSIILPSRHANRRQVLGMAKAFYALLGEDFLLGMSSNSGDDTVNVPTIEMGKDMRSFSLAWKYVTLIRSHTITHVYIREERLFFFLNLYIKLRALPVSIFFEAHTLNGGFFLLHALSRSDGVVSLTKGLQNDIHARYPLQRLTAAHDGVDLDRFTGSLSKQESRKRFNISAHAVVAAYIGRYSTLAQDNKGVGDFIQAFGEARTSSKIPFHLFIMGLAPSEISNVEVVCEKSNIPRSCRTLVPYLPQEEVVVGMCTADMLIMNHPYTQHFARYMSPMKLFEYMTSRVPIITSDLPSVREVLSDEQAFFVPPDNTAALAHMLIFVAQHTEQGVQKAAQHLKRFRTVPGIKPCQTNS